MKKLLIILVSAILIAGCSISGKQVESEDEITVNYVGKFEDGKVFDTSIGEVAESDIIPKASSFSPRGVYRPFTFKVGAGEVIPGFDEGVLGMREGETREITIPPEKGYGVHIEELTEIRPRFFVVDVIEDIPSHDFTEETGIKNPAANQTFAWRDWSARIVTVTNTSVILRNEVSDTTLNTDIGTIEIEVDTGTITQTFTPSPDAVVTTDRGTGRLNILNDSYFIVDYNHPLAGKTLVFDITLESIEKASE